METRCANKQFEFCPYMLFKQSFFLHKFLQVIQGNMKSLILFVLLCAAQIDVSYPFLFLKCYQIANEIKFFWFSILKIWTNIFTLNTRLIQLLILVILLSYRICRKNYDKPLLKPQNTFIMRKQFKLFNSETESMLLTWSCKSDLFATQKRITVAFFYLCRHNSSRTGTRIARAQWTYFINCPTSSPDCMVTVDNPARWEGSTQWPSIQEPGTWLMKRGTR